jgi:hypothetical protein
VGPYPKALEEAARIATADGERRLRRGTPVYSEQGDVVGTTVVLRTDAPARSRS